MSLFMKRCISFLMVLVILVGMVPAAYASEVTEPPVETTTETLPPTEETTVPETTEIPTESTGPPQEETIPETTEVPSEPTTILSAVSDYAVMAAASTQNSIMLFDFADNGDYTSRFNSQVAVSYKPNGTGTTRTAYIKNLGWHFARYGNVPYADDPLYCIEPWRSYGASTSGNSVDREVTMSGSGNTTGSNVWYSLPADRREAIGLILLYSDQMWDDSVSVFNVKRDANPNVPLRVATQILIYEIVCGLRNPTTFVLNSTNECGTAGDIFYNAGVASISNFAPNYNTLVSYVQSALKRPSFTGSSSSNAPTITLTGDETSVVDRNGVLSSWNFTDGNGAEFDKSGNTLYIAQTGPISESKVFQATKSVPSAANSTYNIWYMSGSSYQTTLSLANPSYGNKYAYFKLDPPDLGSLSLTKTTEDGLNLSGWQFGIYSNSACTSLVSGPHTTNSSGKISVSNLSAGTYYVKELGHTNSSINALYYCASTNPQKVTISAGGSASVSFSNKLNTGNLGLTKTTEDGLNLKGWQFSIYSDAACSKLVSGPHTTDESGKISVSGLKPGTYYVKEIGHSDSSITALYYCSSTNPQKVTIAANNTASVSFTNKLNTGSVKLVKETNTGENLARWQIGLYYDAECTEPIPGSPFITGNDGTITVSGLLPGKLYAKELPVDDPYWQIDSEVKTVNVVLGKTATVTFSNTHLGRIKFQKTTNTGNNLGGWTFRVRDMDGNIVGEYTTDETGVAYSDYLPLGRYTIVEIPTEDNYWTGELGFHDAFVKGGEDFVDKWHNREQGLAWFYKATDTGNDLEGWEITIYRDEACTDVVDTVTTREDGKIGRYLDPGIYYAKETGDTLNRFEDGYWVLDTEVKQFEIKSHEDVSIYFKNCHGGKLQIQKSMQSTGPVDGWQFRITDADGKEIPGSPFTTDTEGRILTGTILPGDYTVEEIIPEDSAYYCKSENPQTISVAEGQTAEVSFTNALKCAKVSIEKVDSKGNPLAGATFRLEWSEDGVLWYPVTYSDSADPTEGTCSNAAVEDGCLTSGEDGIIEWDNLLPGHYYRVKETKAPNGYNLLKKTAFEDKITMDDLHITIRVINTRVFTLPETGANSLTYISILGVLTMGCCFFYLVYQRKKRYL